MSDDNRTGPSGLTRIQIEERCAGIGRAIGEVVPEGTGFVFMLFDFGEGDGNFAYISNAERDDMIEFLHEAIGRIGPVPS